MNRSSARRIAHDSAVRLQMAATDWDFLFLWAVANLTRDLGPSGQYIPLQDHLRWVETQDTRHFFIVYSKGEPAGYLRLNQLPNGWRVSIALLSEYRGQGIGTLAVSQAIEMGYTAMVADVLTSNDASIEFFEKLGFKRGPEPKEGLLRLAYAGQGHIARGTLPNWPRL